MGLSAIGTIVAYSGIGHGATIKQLLQRSDAVVIARPLSVTPGGREGTAISLSVVSWLAGGSGTIVTALWKNPGTSVQPTSPSASSLGLWFLKQSVGLAYTVVPAHGGPRPAFRDLYFDAAPEEKRPAALAYPPDVPLRDKIALEVLAGAAFGGHVYNPGDAVAAVSGIESIRVHDAFASLARMYSSLPKAIGLAGLIGMNDPAGVVTLEKDFSAITETDLSELVAGSLYGSFRNADPAGVSSLGRVLVKRGLPGPFLLLGVKALSRIHSADALPYLVQLLDNQNREIRIDAANGLWDFANGVPVQDPMRNGTTAYVRPRPTRWSDETKQVWLPHEAPEDQIDKSVTFWKAWWQANRGRL